MVQLIERACKRFYLIIAEGIESLKEFIPDLTSQVRCTVLIDMHGKLRRPENDILLVALHAVFVNKAGLLQVAHHPEERALRDTDHPCKVDHTAVFIAMIDHLSSGVSNLIEEGDERSD